MSLDDIPEIVVICTQYNGMGLLWWVGGGIGHIKMHAEECEELFVLLLSRNSLQPQNLCIPNPNKGKPHYHTARQRAVMQMRAMVIASGLDHVQKLSEPTVRKRYTIAVKCTFNELLGFIRTGRPHIHGSPHTHPPTQPTN